MELLPLFQYLPKTVPNIRDIALSKIFEYIEMFYNPKSRHSCLNYILPNEFEKRYNNKAKTI